MHAADMGVIGGLFAFDDETGSAATLSIGAGRTGSWGASHQITQASAWGGGLGLWFGCVDASSFSGVSFWVRGETATGTFSTTLTFPDTAMPDATDAAGGGNCVGGETACVNPSLQEIPLTPDWTLIEIPWSSLSGGLAAGSPYAPTGDNLAGITFGLPIAWGPDPAFVDDPNDATDMPSFLPLPSDIIFQIDDISFLP